ncbi:MAG: amidase [Candidatus Binataceae bacterium]
MKNEFANFDATEQAELVRQKDVTPLELVDAAIARIEAINPQLNAVITPLFEKARAQAKNNSNPSGPFGGVPFLMKDLLCACAGDPLYSGMRLLRDARFVAPYDTYLAAKFKAAGFICVGKTNTPELGLNATTEPEAFGPSRNPWNSNHSTGGSSGGSAAAVASRMVAVGHANDGGGSIRIPAGECGLVGLKPSRGRVSLGPDVGEAWHGLAIEGVVTRSVRDTAGVLDAIAGNMPGDPYAAPSQSKPFTKEVDANPGHLRVGLMNHTPKGGAPLSPDCVAAVEDVSRLLESLGHRVEQSYPVALDEPELGRCFDDVVSCHAMLALDQIGTMVGRKLNAEDVELWTWAVAERGFAMPASRYLAAITWLQQWSRRMAGWWADGFDLLLTPTIAAPPPPLGTLVATPEDPRGGWRRVMELIQFTPAYNGTGQPAISLPLYWNAQGLPIGVQLVAAFGREDLLIQVASHLEQARPWKDRRPPICA